LDVNKPFFNFRSFKLIKYKRKLFECLIFLLCFCKQKIVLFVEQFYKMKKTILFLVIITFLCSCGIFGGGGSSSKTGCPANGRAIGAEKLAAGDPKAMKAAQKAPKFKFGN
jgi:hypothetical protein